MGSITIRGIGNGFNFNGVAWSAMGRLARMYVQNIQTTVSTWHHQQHRYEYLTGMQHFDIFRDVINMTSASDSLRWAHGETRYLACWVHFFVVFILWSLLINYTTGKSWGPITACSSSVCA